MIGSMHRIPEILQENSLTGIAIVGEAGEFIDINGEGERWLALVTDALR